MSRTTKKRAKRTRLLGGYVAEELFTAIQLWVKLHPERDVSSFLREAAREKLRRDGIFFIEKYEARTASR